VIFLVLVVLLLVLLVMHNPMQAMLGTLVVAAGLPVYSLLQRE
jgi:hypothetical protein